MASSVNSLSWSRSSAHSDQAGVITKKVGSTVGMVERLLSVGELRNQGARLRESPLFLSGALSGLL